MNTASSAPSDGAEQPLTEVKFTTDPEGSLAYLRDHEDDYPPMVYELLVTQASTRVARRLGDIREFRSH